MSFNSEPGGDVVGGGREGKVSRDYLGGASGGLNAPCLADRQRFGRRDPVAAVGVIVGIAVKMPSAEESHSRALGRARALRRSAAVVWPDFNSHLCAVEGGMAHESSPWRASPRPLAGVLG
jgi:hypothetical protein